MVVEIRLQLASVMILLFVAANYLSAKRRNTQTHKSFTALIISAVLVSICDYLYVYRFLSNESNVDLYYRIYMSVLCIYMFLLQNYIMVSVSENKKYIILNHIVGSIMALIAVAAILFSKIDYVNEMDGIFACNGYAMIAVQGVLILYSLNAFIMTIVNWKRIDNKKRIAIFAASVSQISVFIIQEFFRDILIISIGCVIVIICLYLISENADQLLIEQLEYERDRANVANESKSSFVAHVSHEIRTPINAILGMDEMIIRESKEENIKQYAQDISQAAQTLYGIINDVLDVSKMESGKMDIYPTEYSLNQLIYDAIFPLKPRIKAKQIDLFVDINPTLPSRYFGDDVHIKQILSNLISNAVKYTHEGFIKVSVTGEYKANLMELYFEIKDTGIGIKEEDISKLFVAFERIEESRNRNIEGTGLGMNITNTLLKLMGSRLNVSSVYGEGSIFSFRVTQRIISQDPIGDFAAFQKSQDNPDELLFTAPGVRILVVDDNELNRRVFKSLLARTEIRIDEAEGGRRCLAMIMKEQYDMIFLDHLMPEMDGIETIEKIKANKNHLNTKTPIVMLTANALGDVKEIYRQSGFDAYLAKPVFMNELERLIKAYVPSYKIVMPSKPASISNDISEENWRDMLPNIRGIDWNEAIKHLPSRDILFATLGEFYRSIDSESRMLDEYFAEIEDDDKLELLRIKVHALKGSAALIGAEMLSEGAKEIESAAKEKNTKLIIEKYPYMINYYRSFKERLSELDIKKESEKKIDIDFPQVIALVEMVRLEMNDMNKNNALEMLSEIEEYKYSEEITKDIIRLRNAVEQFDSNMVGEVADRLLTKLRILKNS